MIKPLARPTALAAAALTLAGCSSSSSSHQSHRATLGSAERPARHVSSSDNYYSTPTITLPDGSTVLCVQWDGNNSHDSGLSCDWARS